MIRFWDKVDKSGACWEWTAAKNKHGYGVFGRGAREAGLVKAHRWAFEDANGYLPPVVRHRCDNPGCVNPAHLEAGTPSDNSRDMVERARSVRGEDQHAAKLTEDVVRYLRGPHNLAQRELAALAGVSVPAVSMASRGITWAHVQ